jgi:hypothetical protein
VNSDDALRAAAAGTLRIDRHLVVSNDTVVRDRASC